MTNAERILTALRAESGLTDGELRQRTGIEPHQQVNQICRRLERDGRLRRIERADGRIGNYLADDTAAPQHVTAPSPKRPASPIAKATQIDAGQPKAASALPTVTDTLIILPCSGRKVIGGTSAPGPSVVDLLGSELAERLVEARHRVGASAALEETRLLSAWRRYNGTLYEAAGNRLASAVAAGVPILILSGGYGLVLAEEPIGMYNRRFSLRDWPRQLIEECLAAAAKSLGVRTVVAFCARTTDYAQVIRRASWSKYGIDAWLASADMDGRDGAQVFVPRASGQAVAAFLNGEFDEHWRSTDGVDVRLEPVP